MSSERFAHAMGNGGPPNAFPRPVLLGTIAARPPRPGFD